MHSVCHIQSDPLHLSVGSSSYFSLCISCEKMHLLQLHRSLSGRQEESQLPDRCLAWSARCNCRRCIFSHSVWSFASFCWLFFLFFSLYLMWKNAPPTITPITIRTPRRIPIAWPVLGLECSRSTGIKHEFSLEHVQMFTSRFTSLSNGGTPLSLIIIGTV